MGSDDAEAVDLLDLLRSGGRLALAGAIAAGAIAFLYAHFAQPRLYSATATLVISDSVLLEEEGQNQIAAHQALLESDGVAQKTRQRLESSGILEAGKPSPLGGRLRSEVIAAGRGRASRLARVLIARASWEDPDKAVAIANTWAEVFVEESEVLGPGGSPAAETLLDEHLLPTRERLAGLEAQRQETIELYEQRKKQAASRWDGRIQAQSEKIEMQISEFRSATRSLMEEIVARHQEGAAGAGGWGPSLHRKGLELAVVRAQLAQAPQPLTGPTGAADSALVAAAGGESGRLSETGLLGLDLNALADQLTLRAIALEAELKALAEDRLDEVSRMISEVEKAQFEREAGLTGLIGEAHFRLADLKRQRDLELAMIALESSAALAALKRQIDQLTDLERQLAGKHTSSVVEQVLGNLETVQIASPAVSPARLQPRRVALKTTLGAILGGLMGLIIVLLRGSPASRR